MTETGIRSWLTKGKGWTVVRGTFPFMEYWYKGHLWSFSYSGATAFQSEEAANRVADELRRVSE